MTLRRLIVLLALAAAMAAAQPRTSAPAPLEPGKQVKTYTLPPEKLAQAIAYAHARDWLHFIGFAYGVAVLAGLLAWRVAPRFRNWAQTISRRRIVQAYIFTPLLLLTVDILELPVSLYDQRLSLKYQQSVQGWGSWFWDWSKGELIEFAVLGFVAWMLYGAIRRSARRWWFYFWLSSIPIVLFLLFIAPVVIEPLFYQFEPLASTQPALVAQIEKVVARGGLAIPPGRIYEMKASEKLTSLNAYVAGIGASKRVVVWDTTLRKMTTGQTLFVFGHEMGHYVLGHIWLSIGGICALLLAGLFAAYHAMRRMIARWGARWNILGLDDWAALPLLMLAFAVLSFAAEPATSSFSRMLEHHADIYGLEVIHGIVPDASQAAAQAFQILGEVSLSDPNPSPFIEFWLYDHPSVSDRVRFAAEYDPWGKGIPPQYVR
ncbi:MAG: M48 family metallopeptidase [Bryobacteraceae bacterium]